MIRLVTMAQKKNHVGLEEFFGEYGIETFDVERKHRGFFEKIAVKSSALVGFVVLSVVAGVLLSIVPISLLSTSVFAAEPAVAVWKSVPDDVPEATIAERNRLYDVNGNLYAEIWEENRVELDSLEQVGEYAIDGLISTEDKRFYDHNGFDFQGTVRAFLSGRGGGSGITQQLVKNLQFFDLYADNESKENATERSYGRKLRELKMAMRYEEEHSKDEILLDYFNTVAFGAPNIYGIETASKYFYGKSAKDMTLAEAASLVGTVQNPSSMNMKNPENHKRWNNRKDVVLGRMLAEDVITKEQYNEAKNETVKLVMNETNAGNCWSSKYPIYCEYVLNELLNSERLGETAEDRERVLAKGGLEIQTYLDPVAMEKVDKELERSYGNGNRVIAPTAVVQPGTGGVLAVGQNRDWGNGEGQSTLNTTLVPAGEGSVYKIITLAAALNEGFTKETLDFSSRCPLNPGRNYDYPNRGFKNSVSCEKQGGRMNYKTATAYSSNTWYVELEMKITVEKLKEFSRSVGLAAPDNISNRSLSYTLGTVGNAPVDVAAAFATFSNNGVYCPATPISDIRYTDGTTPPTPDTYNPENDACRAVMSPYASSVVLEALRSNVQGGIPDAFGVKANIPGYDTVGKSGTNGNLNLAWAQLSKQYSVYQNVYDMERPMNGIGTIRFRGNSTSWAKNSAMFSGSSVMKSLLEGHPNQPLDYNNTERDFVQKPINESAFMTVPSVVGMKPEEALNTLRNLGLNSQVSKIIVKIPEGYSEGVIAEQSIAPGERLAKGTDKEVVLFIGGN